MKKIIYFLAAICVLCTMAGISSCDKESRSQIIENLIEDGLDRLNKTDSMNYLCGTWATADKDNADTLWISNDSVFANHTVSKSEEIDLFQYGSYLYYQSFDQMIVVYSSAYDFMSHRPLPDWSYNYLYKVSKLKLSLLNMYTLTLTELDPATGQETGTTTYNYVSDKQKPPYTKLGE